MGRLLASTALTFSSLLGLLGCERGEGRTSIQPAAVEDAAAPNPSSGAAPAGAAVPPGTAAPATGETATGARRPAEVTPRPAVDAPRLRSEKKGFVVVTRADCGAGADAYDLVVHFHGVADAVERSWAQARLPGVLAVANAGTWGRDYKAVYEHRGAYAALLERVSAQLAEICPSHPPKVARVALSGWSAGYAAIRAMLRDVGTEPIDAVLLSDGIHASLVGGGEGSRSVVAADVTPFVAFGRQAVRGDKLLSITHSSIQTPDYASTTETTNYLLTEVGARRAAAQSGDLGGGVTLLSRVEEKGLLVRGYSGEGGRDHGWHLHALDETLYADLQKWWHRPDGHSGR
jgi:hypothetical protein